MLLYRNRSTIHAGFSVLLRRGGDLAATAWDALEPIVVKTAVVEEDQDELWIPNLTYLFTWREGTDPLLLQSSYWE